MINIMNLQQDVKLIEAFLKFTVFWITSAILLMIVGMQLAMFPIQFGGLLVSGVYVLLFSFVLATTLYYVVFKQELPPRKLSLVFTLILLIVLINGAPMHP